MIATALEEIGRGTAEIIDMERIEKLVTKYYDDGSTYTVKAGFDPTAPDLHLGHTVLLQKLATFQKFGGRVQFLIGDFTAMIGDPTGKSITRKILTKQEILKNTVSYTEQAFKILDVDKTEVVYNNDWLEHLGADGMLQLASNLTVARMLERDDFSKRYASNTPIAVSEFMYPLLQGYDSVHLKSDIEIGGTDQKFNLLMGRQLQKAYDVKKQQAILMMPILEGLAGVQKMSKSLGNYIGVTEEPKDIFGKVLSISDDLMWRYYDLLSFRPLEEIAELKTRVANGENPRDIKIMLAKEIIARFHDDAAAEGAHQDFIQRFQKNAIPDDMPELEIALSDEGIAIGNLLKEANLVGSTSDAMRMIKQGAVKINGDKVEDTRLVITEKGENVYQVGKRKFARITLA